MLHRVRNALASDSPILKRMRRAWLSPRTWVRRVVLWGGALCVGTAAVLFAIASERANVSFHNLLAMSPWFPFLVTPLGLAAVAWVARRVFPGSEGSGIPQTIAALHMTDEVARNRVLSLKIVLGKILLTVLAIFSGASVGREGPTVQVGASIMHGFGQIGSFRRFEIDRGLILAGGAAGVAAAFNTPLAGVVFAIEEMSRSFESRTSGTVLTGVIIAGVLSLAVLGDYVYFGRTSASLGTDQSWIAVLACGAVGGLAGGIFSQLLIMTTRSIPGTFGKIRRERPVLFAALCGLLLAMIGFASGGTTFGTGYHEARSILEGSDYLPESFGVLKLFATLVSYISGIPGGVFAPSLAVGAGLGLNLAEYLPYAPVGAVIVLGMVAYFAGVVQAPITAFVIVMEMTDNHDMVLPLMATSLLASATSRIICRMPLYKALAENFLEKTEAAAGHRSG